MQTQEQTQEQTEEQTEEQRKVQKRLGKQPITDSPIEPQSPKKTTAEKDSDPPSLGLRKRKLSNPMGALIVRKAKIVKK